MSFRTGDRCHRCGNPHYRNVEISAFFKKNGWPRRCAHLPCNDMFSELSAHRTASPSAEGEAVFRLGGGAVRAGRGGGGGYALALSGYPQTRSKTKKRYFRLQGPTRRAGSVRRTLPRCLQPKQGKAFSLRRRWHPASHASRMTDEVAGVRQEKTPHHRCADLPLKGEAVSPDPG